MGKKKSVASPRPTPEPRRAEGGGASDVSWFASHRCCDFVHRRGTPKNRASRGLKILIDLNPAGPRISLVAVPPEVLCFGRIARILPKRSRFGPKAFGLGDGSAHPWTTG